MQRQEYIRHQLPEALRAGRMHLLYQPMVRLKDAQVVGLEALCRWSTELLGDVPPDELMPAVQNAGLLDDYRHWLLDTLGQEVPALLARHPLLDVSLNFSLTEMAQPGWFNDMQVWLQRMPEGIQQRWVVEVTEHSFAQPLSSVKSTMEVLRAQGLRFAIDDFGAGASDLLRLRALPVDAIKLDKTWVHGLHQPDVQRRVKDVIAYAQQHGQHVVAEGVETSAHVAQAQALGITLAQGFHFDPPRSLSHWLASPERFA